MIDVKSPTMSLQPKSLLAVLHENCGENAVSSRSLNSSSASFAWERLHQIAKKGLKIPFQRECWIEDCRGLQNILFSYNPRFILVSAILRNSLEWQKKKKPLILGSVSEE